MKVKDLLPRISQLIKHYKTEIFVLLGYLLLTILLTYPVAFQIGTAIPGVSDAFHWMRSLWYTKYAIFNPEITSLTHDNLLFYPYGVPVSPFSSVYNQVLYVLLSPFLELSSFYSIQWLLTFILGAFGTYLLVKYLTKNNYAAFISGIIFAFNPFHLMHAQGHFGATNIQWIPFCALFLMKVFKEGGIKNCIYSGLFFTLVAMSDMQYLLFTGIFIVILITYDSYISVYQKDSEFFLINFLKIFKKYSVFLGVAIPGVLIIAMSDIIVALSHQNFLKPNPYEAVIYSTDLISFFIPAVLHPFFGEFVLPIYNSFLGNSSESTTYIGYTVLLLSLVAFFAYRKDIIARLWLIVAIFFSLLSLGPILHIFGKTSFTVFNSTIPLPYLILYYIIPFMENCRALGRFFVIASLAYAVLAGYGIKKILEYQKGKNIIIIAIIFLFIVFEYLCIPFPTSPVEQPEIYTIISNDSEQYGILSIPSAIKNYNAQVETVYYQTIHNKALVGNHLARIPQNARDFEQNTSFIRELFFLQNFDDDILNQNVTEIANSILNRYNIKYIIIHEKYMSPKEILFATNLINASLQMDPVYYPKDKIIAYKVPDKALVSTVEFGKGWYAIEKWKDGPGRWINREANLNVFSPVNQKYYLTFEVGSFNCQRDLSIIVNNESVQSFNVPLINKIDNTPLMKECQLYLMKGENSIKFSVQQKGTIPSTIGAWEDSRELTLSLQNISLIPN